MPVPARRAILKLGAGMLALAACGSTRSTPPASETAQDPAVEAAPPESVQATAVLVGELAVHLEAGTCVWVPKPENKTSQPERALDERMALVAAGLDAGGARHGLLFVEPQGDVGTDPVLRIAFYDPRSGAQGAWFVSMRVERGEEVLWKGSFEAGFGG